MGPEISCKYTLNALSWKFVHCPGFLSNLRLPWKTEFALKLFTVLNIVLTFQDFWATCACPEESVPWIHCIEYISFIIQDFWATCACPEKQNCPEIFYCIQCIFFIIQDFWAECTCPENRVCPENFQAGGGAAAPHLVHLCLCKNGRPRFSALSNSWSTFAHASDKPVLAKRVHI